MDRFGRHWEHAAALVPPHQDRFFAGSELGHRSYCKRLPPPPYEEYNNALLTPPSLQAIGSLHAGAGRIGRPLRPAPGSPGPGGGTGCQAPGSQRSNEQQRRLERRASGPCPGCRWRSWFARWSCRNRAIRWERPHEIPARLDGAGSLPGNRSDGHVAARRGNPALFPAAWRRRKEKSPGTASPGSAGFSPSSRPGKPTSWRSAPGACPSWGSAEAKVTLIEFSDYQCFFCRRHDRQVAPRIVEEYVESGRLKYFFADFRWPPTPGPPRRPRRPTAPATRTSTGK